MSDVVTVSPQETRVEPVKASSPSWFIARINAVSRIIGALLLCIPMFISLDAVSRIHGARHRIRAAVDWWRGSVDRMP